MFGKSTVTTTDSSVAAPLLSCSEPNDRLPHLTVPTLPSVALQELLQPLPKHLIVEYDAGVMTLRHPADLLGLMGTGMHTVEDLRYCMDIYQLLSQRKLKRQCFPPQQQEDNAQTATTTATTTFLFKYTCCDKNCPFSLSYRRTKNPPAGTSANQCELILPSDDNRDEYPAAHKCPPHGAWQQSLGVSNDAEAVTTIVTATSNSIAETADAERSPMRGSGYCSSTALMDALVTRFLLLERRRRQSSNLQNLENYFIPFQEQLGIQLSKQRFAHGCKLFEQVQRAWPHYRDEDASICDSVYGLWCVGILTKGLPNTMLQFVMTGPPPSWVADPTASLLRAALPWAWYYVRRVGKFLALVVFIYTFGLVLFLGSGSIVLTGAIRGAAHWNQLVTTMESSSDVVEFDGWVSDRLQPLSPRTFCGRLMGCIYGQNHGAMTLVQYLETDGADFTRKFIKTARFTENGLDHVLEVPMKRRSSQWSHAFPSHAFSKKHGILKRMGFGAFGVVLLAYSYTIIPLWDTVTWTMVFGLLQAYFLWISWTCTPPAQPWEGVQAALWAPRGCHDYFSTMTQVLVFRVWAMNLDKPSSSPAAAPRQTQSSSELLPSNPSNIV